MSLPWFCGEHYSGDSTRNIWSTELYLLQWTTDGCSHTRLPAIVHQDTKTWFLPRRVPSSPSPPLQPHMLLRVFKTSKTSNDLVVVTFLRLLGRLFDHIFHYSLVMLIKILGLYSSPILINVLVAENTYSLLSPILGLFCVTDNRGYLRVSYPGLWRREFLVSMHLSMHLLLISAASGTACCLRANASSWVWGLLGDNYTQSTWDKIPRAGVRADEALVKGCLVKGL